MNNANTLTVNTSNVGLVKKIALFTSIVNFIVSIFIWGQFDSSVREYQFVSSTSDILSSPLFITSSLSDSIESASKVREIPYCYLRFGVDGISLYFVLLTTFITPICLLSN
jgi:NADH-ubiquinone oxidoreductase chain 4